jgi:S-adenosylmethionine hydrolase
LFGSSGHLMISVVNGRAIDRLPISIGDQVEVIQPPEGIGSPVP